MSASTVSITAANPVARRRPVVATEKKTATNIELLANDVAVSPAATSGAGTARDLSHHSIRGEAVLERTTNDPSQARRAAGNLPPRRVRKPAAKEEKPRWFTVLRIFAKNLVLLVVLVGLVQLIRRLALKSNDGVDGIALGSYAGLSDFEGRISDMEGSLKRTMKMFQVQVDVVNKKIDDEVGGLRREMNAKIDEKGAVLESGLKKLEAKSEELEKYLGELKTEDWVSRGEFDKIVEGLKNVMGSGYEGGWGLDEIREFAKRVIEKEIEKHAADGLGRVDYALASGGAAVVRHSEAYDVGRGNWFLLAAKNGVHPNADKMLKPSFGEPGQCFPLKGSTGFVQIRLRTSIIPEAVTLEHVAKSVAYDRSSAPKDCRVSGWLQGRNTDSVIDMEKMFLLAEFTYDLEKSNAQTFNVLNSADPGVIDTVRLDFSSNHGSPSHTCIYRFRVHGHELDSVSMMAMQS